MGRTETARVGFWLAGCLLALASLAPGSVSSAAAQDGKKPPSKDAPAPRAADANTGHRQWRL